VLVQEDYALATVLADFSFTSKVEAKGRRHLFGGGSVNDATLQALRDSTHALRSADELKKKRLEVVWVIHFAPFSCGKSLELVGHERVIDSAEKAGVKFVLCGHTHSSHYHETNGVHIICAGAATSVDCKNQIHEIDIDVDSRTAEVKTYEFSKRDKEFLEVKKR
jgi:Icc-related predicted phosphoesterase